MKNYYVKGYFLNWNLLLVWMLCHVLTLWILNQSAVFGSGIYKLPNTSKGEEMHFRA